MKLDRWNVFIVLGVLVLTSCSRNASSTPHPHQAEIEAAVQQYFAVVTEAEEIMDEAKLDEVATGDLLALHRNRIETYQDNPNELAITETRNISVKILDYSPSKAVVEVRYDYRIFLRDLETGQRRYGPSAKWRWRIEELTLLNETGVWKVSEVEFVDWSG
jgi:hypothetical protein